MANVEQCVGCQAEVPTIEGHIHRYMTSAPACWKRYQELLSTLYTGYSRPKIQEALVMAADTYAVHHPGTLNPRAVQSVGIHLLNLHAYLVAGDPVRIPQKNFTGQAFHAIAAPSDREQYWLEPPSLENTVTVFDVPTKGSDDEIYDAVHRWASSVWNAWGVHHGTVAERYEQFSPN